MPALLEGKDKPADNAECLALAQLCVEHKKLYAASAGFYAKALAAQPELAKDPVACVRYNAACVALLAAAGRGKDADKLEDKERARLRRQAMDWLQADLALWNKLADSDDPKAHGAVLQWMNHWQTDADLAGLRDKEAIEKLPKAQRARCQKLWADVDALLARVKPKAKQAPSDKP